MNEPRSPANREYGADNNYDCALNHGLVKRLLDIVAREGTCRTGSGTRGEVGERLPRLCGELYT